MENDKIKIAITQGDINGIGYELILKAFAEPEMLDICTPIIYGSRKAATFHAKTLGLQCPFNFIDKAEDAADGKVNLVKCSEEHSRVEFGNSTETSVAAAVESLGKAVGDAQGNAFDALVCSPMGKTAVKVGDAEFQGTKEFIAKSLESEPTAYEIHISNATRTMCMDKTSADSDIIATKIRLLHKSLRRDFRISNPRIAVTTEGDESMTDIIKTSLKTLFGEGIQAFGPYDAKTYATQLDNSVFDGVLSISDKKTEDCDIALLTGMLMVCTMLNENPHYDIAGKGIADEAMMRNAIYLAIDTCRFRKEFNEPTANPLQKLYKERPDSGEKMRFAIPKKKEE